LQQWLLQAALAGDSEQLYERLLARGKVPSGAFGRNRLQVLVRDVLPYAQLWQQGVDSTQLHSLPCQVDIDGIQIHGRVADVLEQRVPRLRIGKRNASTVVRNGLDWLLLCADAKPRALWQLYLDEEGDLGPHLQPALPQEQARQALGALVGLYLQGLQQPLPYAPRTALAIHQAAADGRQEAAASSWYGSDYSYAEASEDSHQLLYRGRDPLAGQAHWQRFEQTCLDVMSLLTRGQAYDHPGHDADGENH
jgi:exodeoxyribonuclease V gamma subunit